MDRGRLRFLADHPVLTAIRITNFRCFESLRFTVPEGITFLIGENAQGKTSILEAICVALRLQSPRTLALAETIRAGTTGFGLDAHVGGIHLHFRYQPPERRLTLDSVKQTTSAEYLKTARIAWFSNDDIEIVRGSGSRRRRFLDFLCSQIDERYLKNLRDYERALRSRNSLLRDGRPPREIEAFNRPLERAGTLLTEIRAMACSELSPLLADSVREIGGPGEPIALSYAPSVAGNFAANLAASAAEEARLRQTIIGPHRDDFSMALAGMDANRFASEGQQRTLAVALKLAQTRLIQDRTGRTPLLLIDDVFGELDVGRRRNLLACLPHNAQCLITTTHLTWLDGQPGARIFRLADHALHPEF